MIGGGDGRPHQHTFWERQNRKARNASLLRSEIDDGQIEEILGTSWVFMCGGGDGGGEG